jgi:hypothetical protein
MNCSNPDIKKVAAPMMKRLSLELGGKNPALVFDDANLEQAVATLIRAAFLNQGEICLCTSRIYVHQKIFDTFLQKFVEKAKQLKVGEYQKSYYFEISFGFLQFFQIMNKKFDLITNCPIVFFCFLEELKTLKRHFEIN